jgi:glycosyltransferase involved in cell wall biosynthesis
MKILHVVPSFYPAFAYGGPIVSVYELCRNLAALGCEVRVLTTDAKGPDAVLDVPKGTDVEMNGFHVRYCRRRLPHSVSPELLRCLPQYVGWADVVHLTAVYSFPTFPSLTVARALKKPVVWSPRGALQQWRGSKRPTLKRVWDRAAAWLAPSKIALHVTSEQEGLEAQQRFPNFRFVVIPNGIEIAPECTVENGNGTLRLLFLGRIHQKKGIENLLNACTLLDSSLPRPWSLVIAGDGEPAYVRELKSVAARHALKGSVQFVGEIVGEAKHGLFQSADLAVFPSYTENFGMVVAEALAHGVPVIASKGMPWAEVESVGCGLWVENDPHSLETAIHKMSGMPLRAMGRRGREWMVSSFSWLHVAERMMALYRELA